MTKKRQEILEAIKKLSVPELIALLEATFRSLREDLDMTGDTALVFNDFSRSYRQHRREMCGRNVPVSDEENTNATIQDERERRMAAVQRLRGVLKTSRQAPSDAELKDDYTYYLLERYS